MKCRRAVLHPDLIHLLRRRPELWGVGISAMAHVVIG